MKTLIKSLSVLAVGLFIAGCAGESAPSTTTQESGSTTGTNSAEYAAEMSGSGATDSEAGGPAEGDAAPAEGDAPAEGNEEAAPVEGDKAAE